MQLRALGTMIASTECSWLEQDREFGSIVCSIARRSKTDLHHWSAVAQLSAH